MSKIVEYLESDDPLSQEIVELLIAYKEEDNHLDYKQDLNTATDKSWLEPLKDLTAFANTEGGYLVFGVANKNKKLVGLSREIADVLNDANNIHQKINRHIYPQISTLRTKEFSLENKIVVAVHVPQSKGKTHIISKDGAFKQISGEIKTILRQGTFYVRRSGGNHLGDSQDLDELIERRIDQFRESLINKVAQVVKSPANSQVYFSSDDQSDKSTKRVVVDGSSEATSIESISFTVPPKGNEEEIWAWSAQHLGNLKNLPPPLEVWKWYSQRRKLDISLKYKILLFKFSLWSKVPAFYWIQNLKAAQIKNALSEAIRGRPATIDSKPYLMVAAFLGEKYFKTAVENFGSYQEKFIPSQKTFPPNGPRKAFTSFIKMPNQSNAQLKVEKLKVLNSIAETTQSTNKLPGVSKCLEAIKIDCFLYAQDEYK